MHVLEFNNPVVFLRLKILAANFSSVQDCLLIYVLQ